MRLRLLWLLALESVVGHFNLAEVECHTGNVM
jgi:hypothetical protein